MRDLVEGFIFNLRLKIIPCFSNYYLVLHCKRVSLGRYLIKVRGVYIIYSVPEVDSIPK